MPTHDSSTTDQSRIEALLHAIGYGTLAVNGSDGWPIVRPVNFTYADGRIYFHGSTSGEKIEALTADPHVTFVVANELALIPSHFVNAPWACAATQFYECVHIRGRARLVQDPAEKLRALQAMMDKLQPEGQYDTLTLEHDVYAQTMQITGVVAIDIDQMTCRFKTGDTLTEEQRAGVEAGLRERSGPRDAATLAAMAGRPAGAPAP